MTIAAIVMIDRDARTVTKPELCYMWTRLERGFGWHKPGEGSPVPKF